MTHEQEEFGTISYSLVYRGNIYYLMSLDFIEMCVFETKSSLYNILAKFCQFCLTVYKSEDLNFIFLNILESFKTYLFAFSI